MWQTSICVKGMKILDRKKFEFTHSFPSISILLEELDARIRLLKSIILKIPDFANPIKVGDNKLYVLDTDYKNILLKNDSLQKFAELFPSDRIVPYHLKLFYENWKYIDIFKAILPDDCNNLSSYSSIGHIIQLNLKDMHLEYKYIIGQVLLDKIKTCTTVLNKKDVISNEYRNFEYEILAGDHDTNVVVRENNCTFHFDFGKVYWNPRLSTEHERILKILSAQDVVFDIFAGVGPFSIPAARVVRCQAVFANDLNPDCVTYLKENILKNKIKGDVIKVHCMDAKDFILTVIKPYLIKLIHAHCIKHNGINGQTEDDFIGDIHILMNLPEKAIEYIPLFKGLLKQDFDKINFESYIPPFFKIIVHLYCFVRERDHPELAAKHKLIEVINSPTLQGPINHCEVASKRIKSNETSNTFNEDQIIEVCHVRKVSPSKDMVRLTFKLSPSFLGLDVV